MNVATNAVVENKLEPVTKTEPTRPVIVTGQYLYDQFVSNDGSGTRMAWIRTYLVPNADPIQVKGACDELVKIAHKVDIANGVPEKERGPKRNTAMNVRTCICQIFGALKFAPEYMQAMGFDETTGWLEARNMAKPALERAGKIWTGHAIPSDIQKEQKRLQKARKVETDAYLEAVKANPPALNESMDTWNQRVLQAARASVEVAKAEAVNDQAQTIFESLIKKHDRRVLAALANNLLDYLTEENAGQSELSDEETAALLAAHTEPVDETVNV